MPSTVIKSFRLRCYRRCKFLVWKEEPASIEWTGDTRLVQRGQVGRKVSTTLLCPELTLVGLRGLPHGITQGIHGKRVLRREDIRLHVAKLGRQPAAAQRYSSFSPRRVVIDHVDAWRCLLIEEDKDAVTARDRAQRVPIARNRMKVQRCDTKKLGRTVGPVTSQV